MSEVESYGGGGSSAREKSSEKEYRGKSIMSEMKEKKIERVGKSKSPIKINLKKKASESEQETFVLEQRKSDVVDPWASESNTIPPAPALIPNAPAMKPAAPIPVSVPNAPAMSTKKAEPVNRLYEVTPPGKFVPSPPEQPIFDEGAFNVALQQQLSADELRAKMLKDIVKGVKLKPVKGTGESTLATQPAKPTYFQPKPPAPLSPEIIGSAFIGQCFTTIQSITSAGDFTGDKDGEMERCLWGIFRVYARENLSMMKAEGHHQLQSLLTIAFEKRFDLSARLQQLIIQLALCIAVIARPNMSNSGAIDSALASLYGWMRKTKKTDFNGTKRTSLFHLNLIQELLATPTPGDRRERYPLLFNQAAMELVLPIYEKDEKFGGVWNNRVPFDPSYLNPNAVQMDQPFFQLIQIFSYGVSIEMIQTLLKFSLKLSTMKEVTQCLYFTALGRVLQELARADGTPRHPSLTQSVRLLLSKCILNPERAAIVIHGVVQRDLNLDQNWIGLADTNFLERTASPVVRERILSILFDILTASTIRKRVNNELAAQSVFCLYEPEVLASISELILWRLLLETEPVVFETINARLSDRAVGEALDRAWKANCCEIAKSCRKLKSGSPECIRRQGALRRLTSLESLAQKTRQEMEEVLQLWVASNTGESNDAIAKWNQLHSPLPPELSVLAQQMAHRRTEYSYLPKEVYTGSFFDALMEAQSLGRPLYVFFQSLGDIFFGCSEFSDSRVAQTCDANYVTWFCEAGQPDNYIIQRIDPMPTTPFHMILPDPYSPTILIPFGKLLETLTSSTKTGMEARGYRAKLAKQKYSEHEWMHFIESPPEKWAPPAAVFDRVNAPVGSSSSSSSSNIAMTTPPASTTAEPVKLGQISIFLIPLLTLQPLDFPYTIRDPMFDSDQITMDILIRPVDVDTGETLQPLAPGAKLTKKTFKLAIKIKKLYEYESLRPIYTHFYLEGDIPGFTKFQIPRRPFPPETTIELTAKEEVTVLPSPGKLEALCNSSLVLSLFCDNNPADEKTTINEKAANESKLDPLEEDGEDVSDTDELAVKEKKKKDLATAILTDAANEDDAPTEAAFDKFAGGPAIDDRPTGDDKLSHGRYAEKLAEVLCSPQTQPPITVGVYAQWGGGKSFFLDKLKYFLLSKLSQRNVEWQDAKDEEERRKDEQNWKEAQEQEELTPPRTGLCSKRPKSEQLKEAYLAKWQWLLNKYRMEKFGTEIAEHLLLHSETTDVYDQMIEQASSPQLPWYKRCFSRRRAYTQLANQTEDNRLSAIAAINLAAESQRPPPPPPSLLVRMLRMAGINTNAIWALSRIWKKLPKDNRNSDSIKPLPVKMKFIDFNSWLYSGSDSLWAAFASHLFEQTEEHFGEITTRIYRARYNDAFGKLSKTFFILTFIFLGLLIAALVCVLKGIGPFSGQNDAEYNYKVFGGLGSMFIFAFSSLLVSSKDVILNLATSQAQSILKAMDKPDFSARMGFMNQIKEEIDIISSMMRHGEWYDEQTGLEHRSQFVIFIDDLDRCPAEKVVEVLKALVLLFSSPNAPFIAVLAIDPRLVVQAIESVHNIGHGHRAGGGTEAMVNGYEYLDKIVQLPFCFPDLQSADKQRLLHSFLPIEQNIRAAFLDHDYGEVAALIMKSFLGYPTSKREEIKEQVKDTITTWIESDLKKVIIAAEKQDVLDLSPAEAAEYKTYQKSQRTAQGRTALTAAGITSIIALLIPLLNDPKRRFSIPEHMKKFPKEKIQLTLKRIDLELKKLLKLAEEKYMEQSATDRTGSIKEWRDNKKLQRRQNKKQIVSADDLLDDPVEQQSSVIHFFSPSILEQKDAVMTMVTNGTLQSSENSIIPAQFFIDWNTAINKSPEIKKQLKFLFDLMCTAKLFELEVRLHSSSTPTVVLMDTFHRLLEEFRLLLTNDPSTSKPGLARFSQSLQQTMMEIQQTVIMSDMAKWMEENELVAQQSREASAAGATVQPNLSAADSQPSSSLELLLPSLTPLTPQVPRPVPSALLASPSLSLSARKQAWDLTSGSVNLDIQSPSADAGGNGPISEGKEEKEADELSPYSSHPFAVPNTEGEPTEAIAGNTEPITPRPPKQLNRVDAEESKESKENRDQSPSERPNRIYSDSAIPDGKTVADYRSPRTIEDCLKIVQYARSAGSNVRIFFGANHSSPPASASEGVLVDGCWLNTVNETTFDPLDNSNAWPWYQSILNKEDQLADGHPTVYFSPGITPVDLEAWIQANFQRGYRMPMSTVEEDGKVPMGGIIAMDTDKNNPIITNRVVAMEYIDWEGKLQRITRKEFTSKEYLQMVKLAPSAPNSLGVQLDDKDIFHTMLMNLGRFGIIWSYTMRLYPPPPEPAFINALLNGTHLTLALPFKSRPKPLAAIASLLVGVYTQWEDAFSLWKKNGATRPTYATELATLMAYLSLTIERGLDSTDPGDVKLYGAKFYLTELTKRLEYITDMMKDAEENARIGTDMCDTFTYELNVIKSATQTARKSLGLPDQSPTVTQLDRAPSAPTVTSATVTPSVGDPLANTKLVRLPPRASENVLSATLKEPPTVKIRPRQIIYDWGVDVSPSSTYSKMTYGFAGAWVDLQGQGVKNDYARFVQPSKAHTEPFLSVALAGTIYPYTPPDLFIYDHQLRCVRLNTSHHSHYRSVIYDYPNSVGQQGSWLDDDFHQTPVPNSNLTYARLCGRVNDQGQTYLTVTRPDQSKQCTLEDEYERLQSKHEEKLVAGAKHPYKYIFGKWFDTSERVWVELTPPKSGNWLTNVGMIVNGHCSPKWYDENDNRDYVGYFDLKSEELYLMNKVHEESMGVDGGGSIKNWKGSEWHEQQRAHPHQIMKLAFNPLSGGQRLENFESIWLKHGYTPEPTWLTPLTSPTQLYEYGRVGGPLIFEASSSPSEHAWPAEGGDAGANTKTLDRSWSTVSPGPFARRTIRMELPKDVDLGNQFSDIHFSATYSFDKCTTETGDSLDKPTGTPVLPDYSYRVRVVLLNSKNEMLDEQIVNGEFFPATHSFPSTSQQRWYHVGGYFPGSRRDFHPVGDAKVTHIQWEELCTRGGTIVRHPRILVRPLTVGYAMKQRARAELFDTMAAVDWDASTRDDWATIRSFDSALSYWMNLRLLPQYQSSSTSKYFTYGSASTSTMPSSLLDYVIAPNELVQLNSMILHFLLELDHFWNNRAAKLNSYDKKTFPFVIHVDGSKAASPAEYVLPYDRLPPMDELKEFLNTWLSRTFVANTSSSFDPLPRLIHQPPLQLPVKYTNNAELLITEFSETPTGLHWSFWMGHLCLLYLNVPTLPLSSSLTAQVRRIWDLVPMKKSAKFLYQFLQFPCVRLWQKHTNSAFVAQYEAWNQYLITLRAIPQLQEEFGFQELLSERVGDIEEEFSLTKWNDILFELLKRDQPTTSLEHSCEYWKECAEHKLIQLFPDVITQVRSTIKSKEKELNELEESKQEEEASIHSGLTEIEINALAVCSPYMDGNPRRIKRIMNIYNVSRLLVERKRHIQAKDAEQCKHSFCIAHNQQVEKNKKLGDKGRSVEDDPYSNPLASVVSLRSVFHPPHMSYNLVRPGLFRFILLLEQWPYRAAWLLHIIQHSQKKWQHLQEAIDIIHQNKVKEAAEQQEKINKSRLQTKKESDASTSSTDPSSISPPQQPSIILKPLPPPPSAVDIPLESAVACGMFPPSWSLLQLYRYVHPLIYGHRQPRDFTQTVVGNGASAREHHKIKLHDALNVFKATSAFKSSGAAWRSHHPHQDESDEDDSARPLSARHTTVAPSANTGSSNPFGFVSSNDFDDSVRRHVRDTESLLSMDSDPDNFILFLSLPLDETKDALDPFDLDIHIDGDSEESDDDSSATPRNNGPTLQRLMSQLPPSDAAHLARAVGHANGRGHTSSHSTLPSTSTAPLLSPSLLHICDLFDLSYLAFNLNPALKRQVAILADLTAAYQPVEGLIHQFVLTKYASSIRANRRSGRSTPAMIPPSPTLNGLGSGSASAASASSSSASFGSLPPPPLVHKPTLNFAKSMMQRSLSKIREK